MAFNPNDHITRLKKTNKDYLPVAARLQWIRDDAPESIISTELVRIDGEESMERAIFRAEITIVRADQVLGKSTGWGSETYGDHPDFIEKAETKAIGRALAALGYGTQFAVEIDEGDRTMDSSQRRGDQASGNEPTHIRNKPANAPLSRDEGSINPGQVKAIRSMQRRLGWSDQKLIDFVKQPIETLPETDAGALISDLNKFLTEGERGQ